MSIECAFFGSLSRDAEAKTSKNGKRYLRLNVRVGDGDQAQFVSVTCFDQAALGQAEKFVKGARCYVEGALKLEQWSGQDGVMRHGLSCLSWHTRLSEIGKNRPRKEREPAAKPQSAARPNDFHDDSIPF
jgi:single-stranded DNA-binding protein